MIAFPSDWGGGGANGRGPYNIIYMRGPRKFCQRGSNFDKVFMLLFF